MTTATRPPIKRPSADTSPGEPMTTNTATDTTRGISPMHLALMAAVRLEKRAAVNVDSIRAAHDEDGLHVDLTLDSTTEDGSAWRDGLDAAAALGLTRAAEGYSWTEWAGRAEHADVTLVAYYETGGPMPLRLRLMRLRNHPAAGALLLAASAAAGSALTLAARRIGGTR